MGRGGAATITVDYLGILSDPEYMAGVKEKLSMIASFIEPLPNGLTWLQKRTKVASGWF